MANINQEKIVSRFLRQKQTSRDEKVIKYELRHASKGSKGTPVETFDIVEALDLDQLDMLAHQIYECAQTDADGIGPSVQRYVLLAYIEDGTSCGRVPFRVRGNVDAEIDEEDGEEFAANSKGLLGQLMKHNAEMARVQVMSTGSMLTAMARRMESLDRTVEKLMDDRQKTFEILENARTEEAERQLLIESEHAKQKRIDFGMQKLALLAPVALDHMTGGKLGAKDTPQSLMIRELMGSIGPEQLQVLVKIMKPEQQLVFFRLFEAMKQSEEKEKPANGQASPSEPDLS